MSHLRVLVLASVAALVPGCNVIEAARSWIESDPFGGESDASDETDAVAATGEAATDDTYAMADAPAADTDAPVNPDAIALAQALLPAPSDATQSPPSAPIEAAPSELELVDLELEWIDRGGYYYGGYYPGGPEAPKALRIGGRAKVTAQAGEKAEVVLKVSCEDGGGEVHTDADISTVDDSYVTRVPAPGTEFRIGARLFLATPPSDPTACRVTATLRDPSRTPVRRGAFERCWASSNGKRAVVCEPTAKPQPPIGEERWTVVDAQFLPTFELGLSVVAGRARAPDRVAVRATCHAGDKHFVEHKIFNGRWYALAPGESLRMREQLQSSWEFLRYADCDIEVQDVGYDFEKHVMRGTKPIAKLCSRPIGIRKGGCRSRVPELPALEPGLAPAKIDVLHGGAHGYRGWLNAYMSLELTMLGPVPTGTKLHLVAHCGGKSETQIVTVPTPIELVYPGETLRVHGNVSFATKMPAKSCTTEVVLGGDESSGAPRWSLGKQCFDRHGSVTPCPGAPPPTTIGFSGVSGGSLHHLRVR